MRVKLRDVCTKITDGSHYSPADVGTGYPMLSIQDMISNGFDYSNCKHISQIEYDNLVKNGCQPQKHDVLIAKDGSYLKEVFVVKETRQEVILSSIAILRPDTSIINPYFLKYYLSTQSVKETVAQKYVSGSVLKRIILKNFENIEIDLPDRATQDKIVEILSGIDEQIERNNGLVKSLQVLSNTIYSRWFLQFDFPDKSGRPYRSLGGEMMWDETLKCEIPKGWSVTSVGKITRNYDSKRVPLSQNERNEMSGDVPYYGATGIVDHVNQHIFDGQFVLIAEDGSIMDSNGNPIIQMIYGKTWVNNHAHVLKGCDGYSNELLYLLLQHIPVVKIMTGSIQKKINQDNLSNYKIPLIPKAISQAFYKVVKPIFEELFVLQQENKKLTMLRNRLLPMLINEQLNV